MRYYKAATYIYLLLATLILIIPTYLQQSVLLCVESIQSLGDLQEPFLFRVSFLLSPLYLRTHTWNATLSLLLSLHYSLITQVVNNEEASQKLRLWIVLQVRSTEIRFCKKGSAVSEVKMTHARARAHTHTHTHIACCPQGLRLSVYERNQAHIQN